MDYQIIARPNVLPVTIEDARLSTKIDGNELDSKLILSIHSITSRAEHLMRRAVMEQTWQGKAAVFPSAIRLINPPLIEIEWIKYLGLDGTEKTVDPSSFYIDVGDETYVYPIVDWPQTLGKPGSVKVQYKCGYGTLPEHVPEGIRDYILATLADQFEPTSNSVIDLSKPSFAEALLDRYKVWV